MTSRGSAVIMGPVLLVLLVAACVTQAKPPNIVFIVADDLGWNDVGWHNPDMITPNLDKMAKEGVILNTSYVQYVCSPSRNAFMTGYFPIHTGLQHSVIHPPLPYGVPLNLTFLPQRLKQVGYATHIVGKWHLGFCKWEYTPTYRGFDTFYGYYNGAEDYYTHFRGNGLDFHDDKQPVRDQNGTYSASSFGKRAIEIIQSHDMSKPLYLYLPFQSVHAPLQVPQKYEDMYPSIKTKARKTKCGMVTAMDDEIGQIIQAMQTKGLMENTLIVFTSDNGGPIEADSNNWPLRGGKHTLWEGGHRVAAFVWGNMLLKTGYINNEMIHAVDWFPTLLHLAGVNPEPGIDGMNIWDTINTGAKSPRTEFVYNIDELLQKSGIRVGDFKLLEGEPGPPDGWYPPPAVENDYADDEFGNKPNKTLQLRLFNIKDDPLEKNDLAKTMPAMVQQMKARLEEYKKSQHPPFSPTPDPKSNPSNYNGVWSPGWC